MLVPPHPPTRVRTHRQRRDPAVSTCAIRSRLREGHPVSHRAAATRRDAGPSIARAVKRSSSSKRPASVVRSVDLSRTMVHLIPSTLATSCPIEPTSLSTANRARPSSNFDRASVWPKSAPTLRNPAPPAHPKQDGAMTAGASRASNRREMPTSSGSRSFASRA